MNTTDTTPTVRRRSRVVGAEALTSDLRARLLAYFTASRPEGLAARINVSVATLRRARDGKTVSAIVRDALARELGAESPQVAA